MDFLIEKNIGRQATEFRRAWSVPAMEYLVDAMNQVYYSRDPMTWPQEMETLKLALKEALEDRGVVVQDKPSVMRIGDNVREVRGDGLVILVSYEVPVAALYEGGDTVRTGKRWSNMTSKHITQWLSGRRAPVTLPQEDIDGLLVELTGRNRLDP